MHRAAGAALLSPCHRLCAADPLLHWLQRVTLGGDARRRGRRDGGGVRQRAACELEVARKALPGHLRVRGWARVEG